ncbi:MAG: IS66 family insertion sequence element accessory protein TnpA [Rubripirellula sp.]
MARSKRSAEKEEFWRLVLEEQRRCGLSVRKFCQQKAISEPSFYSWRKELPKRDAERAADAEGNGRLIPVDIVTATCDSVMPRGQNMNMPVEICTPRGFTLRFDHGTPPGTISRLLDVIARCPVGGELSC